MNGSGNNRVVNWIISFFRNGIPLKKCYSIIPPVSAGDAVNNVVKVIKRKLQRSEKERDIAQYEHLSSTESDAGDLDETCLQDQEDDELYEHGGRSEYGDLVYDKCLLSERYKEVLLPTGSTKGSILPYVVTHNASDVLARARSLLSKSELRLGRPSLDNEVARKIEKKLLYTGGSKASPAIEDISIAGRVVKVRMANDALCDAKAILNSKYFKKNGLSVISFAVPESGCEFSVDRISDRLFNYVVKVIKRKLQGSEKERDIAHYEYLPSTEHDAGALDESFPQDREDDELCEHWERSEYGNPVYDNSLLSGRCKEIFLSTGSNVSFITSNVSSILARARSLLGKSELRLGRPSLDNEVARKIEKKLLYTGESKASCAIENVSITGRVIKVVMSNGALCDAREILNSKYFKKNGLSVISFAVPESSCEFSVERISERLFNYVVTKGVIAYHQKSEYRGGRLICKGSVIIGADGAVSVADVGKMRDSFARDDQDMLIEGRSLRCILHSSTGWERVVGEETGHVAYRTSIKDYPSCIISDIRVAPQERCYANRGGGETLKVFAMWHGSLFLFVSKSFVQLFTIRDPHRHQCSCIYKAVA